MCCVFLGLGMSLGVYVWEGLYAHVRVCLGVGVHGSGREPVKIGGKTTTHSIVILDSGTELISESPLYGKVVCCLFEAF